MLNPKTYQTPNAIDPGEAPPSRPSRRISASNNNVPSVQDVRANAARLLQASDQASPPSMRSTFPYDADDIRDEEEQAFPVLNSDNGSSLPSVEEARLYAGRILSAKSTRDLSPASAERSRLTGGNNSSSSNINNNSNSMSSFNVDRYDTDAPARTGRSFGRSVPLVTPLDMQRKRQRTMRVCLYVTMAMAVLAIIIGLSTHITHTKKTLKSYTQAEQQQQQQQQQTTVTTPPTEAGPQEDDRDKLRPSQRLLDTRNFLRSYSISNNDHVDTAGSAQDLAAVWMADHDALQYGVPTAPSGDTYIAFVQRYVLAVLYFSTHGTGWENQNLFLDKVHECAWFTRDPLSDGEVVALGVSCDDQLEVSELLMPRNNLKGSIPTELSHLTKLDFVDLNRNALTGAAIPDTFARLTDMKFYDVRYNTMTGTIPLWIGAEWPQLTELALAENEMGGALPGSMSLLNKLKSLALANNDFDGNLAPIMSLNSLEFLYLETNRFAATVDDTFMASMETLVQVDLSSNHLTGTDLPAHLFKHPKLQVLDLSDNNIMGAFPADVGSNNVLQYLAIADNILTGTLPPAIGQLSRLHHLDVTGNDLSGPIPEALASMSKLTFLFLSENGFQEGPIPDFLSTMHQLRELSLSSTQRTGVLPSHWLGGLSDLVLFDVSYNKLTGQVPPVMWELPKLGYLLLNRNELTGELPAGIADAAQLKMMLLDKNDITGDLSGVCTIQQQNVQLKTLIADCDDITGCTCCKCCSDSELRCNDDILYTNQDFSWEHNYTRTSYAFSPDILFESK